MSALALSIFSLCNTDPSSHHKTEQNKNLEMSPWGEKKNARISYISHKNSASELGLPKDWLRKLLNMTLRGIFKL